jgi:hypothetical protein
MGDMEAVHCTGTAFRGGGEFPIHLFQLDEIGLDREAFVRELRPSFDRTGWDEYDVANRRFAHMRSATDAVTPADLDAIESNLDGRTRIGQINALIDRLSPEDQTLMRGIQPHRRRALRKYHVSSGPNGGWRIEPREDASFNQAVSDFRARTRQFQLVEREVTYHPGILKLIASAAETVRAYHPDAQHLDVALHQMTVVARPRQAGHPAPEGLHQDGSDFIVSALIVERHGVRGATSKVRTGRDGDPVLEIELAQGQGIFQADAGSTLWHEVSPIDLEDGVEIGHRMAFGLDLQRC